MIDLKVNSKFANVIGLKDLHCKDYSHRCTSISASSCRVPIEANLCKRSCGLCNGVQPPGFPTYPISTPVPIPGLQFT